MGSERDVSGLLSRHLESVCVLVERQLRQDRPREEIIDHAREILRFGPLFSTAHDELFRVLLARMVVRALQDRRGWFAVRRRQRAREGPLPSVDLDATAQSPTSEEGLVLLAIELLVPDEHNVLVLREWDRMSFGGIAEWLDTTEREIRATYRRALTNLGKIARRAMSRNRPVLAAHPPVVIPIETRQIAPPDARRHVIRHAGYE